MINDMFIKINNKSGLYRASRKVFSYLNVALYLKFSLRSAAREVRVKPTQVDSEFSSWPSDMHCDWN